MNMQEYLKVKDMTYLEYCDYLQNKYGIGLVDYMTKSFNKNPKISRTKEGLYAHHKMENTAPRLSNRDDAMQYPYEWQLKENIVYCDALEHLLLHVLICKFPAEDKVADKNVGIAGIVVYMVPELNDVYSGWTTKLAWQKNCHDKIINDKDVYLAILKQFIDDFARPNHLKKDLLLSSAEDFDGLNRTMSIIDGNKDWSIEDNEPLFKEIRALW